MTEEARREIRVMVAGLPAEVAEHLGSYLELRRERLKVWGGVAGRLWPLLGLAVSGSAISLRRLESVTVLRSTIAVTP